MIWKENIVLTNFNILIFYLFFTISENTTEETNEPDKEVESCPLDPPESTKLNQELIELQRLECYDLPKSEKKLLDLMKSTARSRFNVELKTYGNTSDRFRDKYLDYYMKKLDSTSLQPSPHGKDDVVRTKIPLMMPDVNFLDVEESLLKLDTAIEANDLPAVKIKFHPNYMGYKAILDFEKVTNIPIQNYNFHFYEAKAD